jgi:hypothetical protein
MVGETKFTSALRSGPVPSALVFDVEIHVPVVGVAQGDGIGATAVEVGLEVRPPQTEMHSHDQLVSDTNDAASAPVALNTIRTAARLKTAAAFRIGFNLLSSFVPRITVRSSASR